MRRLVDILSRNRLILLGAILATTALTVTIALSKPVQYTASSVFHPQVEQSAASRFGGVAAQLGISMPQQAGTESPQLYAALLKSRELLQQAALTEYTVTNEGAAQAVTGSLLELYHLPPEIPADNKLRAAVDRLRSNVTVRTDPASGLMTLQTTAPWPELAVSINETLLRLLSEFNLERRQSRAVAEREFVEARLEEARQELARAEREMESFLQRNPQYRSSLELTFRAGGLQRRVDLRQQVYLSLAQAFEQARIEEVRNTAVIAVIDHPAGSESKQSRGLVTSVLLGVLLGGIIGLGVAMGRSRYTLFRSAGSGRIFPESSSTH